MLQQRLLLPRLTNHIVINTDNINSQMLQVEQVFPNLFLEGNFVKGEINICAIYNGRKLIHNPNEKDKQTYKDTFVKDFYEIKIDLDTSKVFEIGNKIEKCMDNHFNQDNSCCLGLFKNPNPKKLLDFIKKYVCPFFVWQAYKQKYNKIPPWGEWSHGEKGIEEFKNSLKNIERNDFCPCGSGKKYKKCCLK